MLGNYQQAINDYNKVVELNPQYAAAYHNRGIAYARIGNTQQAMENFKIAARLGFKGAQDILRSNGIEDF
jgi:Flp pilus assembly protein TadD